MISWYADVALRGSGNLSKAARISMKTHPREKISDFEFRGSWSLTSGAQYLRVNESGRPTKVALHSADGSDKREGGAKRTL